MVKCPRCPNEEMVTGTEYWSGNYTSAAGITTQSLSIGGVRLSCFSTCYPGAKRAKYTPTTPVKRTVGRGGG
jgi:hypothetical protein